MSKQQKKQKEIDQSLDILSQGDIIEANSVFIFPLSPDFQNGRLNNQMVLQYFKEMSLNQVINTNQNLKFQIYGINQLFKILKINDGQNDIQKQYLITKRTTFFLLEIEQEEKKINENIQVDKEENKEEISPKIQIIGKKNLNKLENYINLSLLKKEIFIKNQLPPLKGIILHGLSGTGKSSLVKQVSKKFKQIKFLIVNSQEFLSKLIGEGEKRIENLFSESKKNSPSVLVFDDFDIISSKNQKSLIYTFCAQIDQLNPEDNVFFIGISKDLLKIDEQIRRSGRIDRDIKIEIPKTIERLEILQFYLKDINNNIQEEQIQEINSSLNGYTPADVVNLLRESLLECGDQPMQKSHIDLAMESQQPSGIKDIIMDIPKVYWSEIGGYESVKQEIQQVIEWPLKHAESFERLGIEPSRGILLYGPPGCSKTMIAKAIATESKLNFLAVKGPELFSKYVGDSEKAIRDIFKRARQCSPSVIFFDEIDAIATQRSIDTDVSERVLCQLLNEMDGIETLKQVIVVAATNRPEIIDKALTRPGRFDHMIYVPPPTMDERLKILQIYTSKMPLTKEINLTEIATKSSGFSGAEICLVTRQAGLNALTRDISANVITQVDFDKALLKIKPRITKEMIQDYLQFADNLKFF